jgi:hypothetical protein
MYAFAVQRLLAPFTDDSFQYMPHTISPAASEPIRIGMQDVSPALVLR